MTPSPPTFADLVRDARFDEAAAEGANLLAAGDDPALRNMMAYVEVCRGRAGAALEHARRAAELSPQNAAYRVNLARVLSFNRRAEEAIAELGGAVRMAPTLVEAHALRAEVLIAAGRSGEALAALDEAAANVPDHADLLFVRANALRDIGRGREALAAYQALLARRPTDERVYSAWLGAMNYGVGLKPAEIADAHRRYARQMARFHPVTAMASPPVAGMPLPRPLRVGFVSGDIRAHSVSFFLEPLLRGLDRGVVVPIAYATIARRDFVTERLAPLFSAWRTIEAVDPDRVCGMIRADAIHVLIDLCGHSGSPRMDVFRRRPAPVQATYLGYPNTTGLSQMDFRIVDSVTDPPGAEGLTAERLVRLDPCFLCYAPPAGAPDPSPPPEGDSFTFGSFNSLAKLSDETVDLWAGVLLDVPGSRLVLKSIPLDDPIVRADVAERFKARGVGAERLSMSGWRRELTDHLGAYAAIDVALDPFPYHGTTTTCEALWMGVPVVSLAGEAHASRVGATLLGAVGLSELVAGDPAGYRAITARLAADRARLAAWRATLRGRVAASALCDAPAFCRGFERALLSMWAGE